MRGARSESRRAFLERLGALAAAGLPSVLGAGVSAQPNTPGWMAPPVLTNPNILLIMVDQMRYVRGLTPEQASTLQTVYMPNVMGKLRNNSYAFQNYFTAGAACTVARATLLTGLYAPQTCVYSNGGPALNAAYPTWGSGIRTLNPAYQNVWWFGKWHLSNSNNANPLLPYGFETGLYPGGLLTNPITGMPYYASSPNGTVNEGLNGGICAPGLPTQGTTFASDSMIAGDFINWIGGQGGYTAPGTPWCAAVSFINPHDIADAPGAFTNPGGLGQAAWFPSDFPAGPPPPGLPPPLCTHGPANYENVLYPSLPNYVGDIKPSWHAGFARQINNVCGGPVTNWTAFLNQYYWLHYYVDQQVGQVLSALNQSPFAGNTIVIFIADHGEFAGSHGLHDKGGAVYEETMHIPMYIHFPGQTGTTAVDQLCSSVDFFGLICDLATSGAGLWSTAYPDLAHRQSLWSFLYADAPETRLVSIGGAAPAPYVMHTIDETINTEFCPPGPVPPPDNRHIIGLRTKSQGKLGYYCHWAPSATCWDGITAPEHEFYNLSTNPNELGNNYPSDPLAADYMAALGNWGPPPNGVNATGLIGSELAAPLSAALQPAQAAARQAFVKFVDPCGK